MSRCPSECRILHIQAQRGHRQRYRQRRRVKPENPEVKPTVTVEDADEEGTNCGEINDPDMFEVGDRLYACTLQSDAAFIRASSTVSQRLAEASERQRMQRSWKESVPTAYHDFQKVFLKESFDELPQQRKWDHAIELVPGAEPSSTKLYPMSPNEQDELDRFLDENLKSGRIRPSKSPMGSPVFFIKKKDSGLQFVQDYRKLN